MSFKNVSSERLGKIITQLPIIGDYRIKWDHSGFSTNCIFIQADNGEFCLRLYGAKNLKAVEQEVDALGFCYAQKLPVPKLIKWQNGDYLLRMNDVLAICYPCIEGQSVKQKDLCPQIAVQAGDMLCQLINSANLYKSKLSPRDEYDFIHHYYIQQRHQVEKNLDQAVVQQIENILHTRLFDRYFKQLTKGLVHGDFYYGNVLIKDQKLCAVIDFGDAYYGAPFFDVVTGAMEFSFNKNQQLELEYFQAFLIPLRSWLIKEHVSAEIFYHAMLLICIKFLLLTLGKYNENDYVKRFDNLTSIISRDKIAKIYLTLFLIKGSLSISHFGWWAKWYFFSRVSYLGKRS